MSYEKFHARQLESDGNLPRHATQQQLLAITQATLPRGRAAAAAVPVLASIRPLQEDHHSLEAAVSFDPYLPMK